MILINHELKTPLTSILSFGSLLKETSMSDEQNLFVDRILKSTEKLKNIVDDALLIVKGELNQIPIKIESVRIESFFQQLPDDIQKMLNTKMQSLNLSLNVTHVDADPQHLRTLINRALHNAVKFATTQSQINITSKIDNSFVVIEIQNSGPQISQNILDKIVKPFTLDENVMNHSVGMGLGLTICQTLLKAHQGYLQIQNTDTGVLVRFNIPAIRK